VKWGKAAKRTISGAYAGLKQLPKNIEIAPVIDINTLDFEFFNEVQNRKRLIPKKTKLNKVASLHSCEAKVLEKTK
jgi:hypothetical protein